MKKFVSVLMVVVVAFLLTGCEEPGKETTGTVTDTNGNIYKTVKIGDQWWMAENLKVTHYRDGTAIPNVTDNNSPWFSISYGAMCYYKNEADSAETYGALYNWYAVNDIRNIAPAGWHVPTDDEWKELEMTLGMSQSEADDKGWRGTDEGKKLKSTTGWYSDGNGIDEVAFFALPAGFRNYYDGYFYSMGNTAYFWSATEYSTDGAWYRGLYYVNDTVDRYSVSKQYGYSVRCIKGERPNSALTASFEVTPGSGTIDTVFTFDASNSSDFKDELSQLQFRWDFESDGIWDVDWSSNYIATYQYDTAGTYNILMEVKDTNGLTDSTYNKVTVFGTLTDIDGNVYKTVKIGNQWWMAENLRVTKYRDGTAIPNVTDDSTWISTTDGAMCYYNNDSGNAATYGALYNWYAVNDSRNIAPRGWHVPTDAEWTQLTDYLGGLSIAGNKLKSTTGWAGSSNGTDEVAYCALPAGWRGYDSGGFDYMGYYAYFWSTTEYDANYAWYRELYYNNDRIYRYYGDDKYCGFAVRLVQD